MNLAIRIDVLGGSRWRVLVEIDGQQIDDLGVADTPFQLQSLLKSAGLYSRKRGIASVDPAE